MINISKKAKQWNFLAPCRNFRRISYLLNEILGGNWHDSDVSLLRQRNKVSTNSYRFSAAASKTAAWLRVFDETFADIR